MRIEPHSDETAHAAIGRLMVSFSMLNSVIVASIHRLVAIADRTQQAGRLPEKDREVSTAFKRRIGQLHSIVQKLDETQWCLPEFSRVQSSIRHAQFVRDDLGHGSVLLFDHRDQIELLVHNQRAKNVTVQYLLPLEDLTDMYLYTGRAGSWLNLLTDSLHSPDEYGTAETLKSLKAPSLRLLDRYPDRQYPWFRLL